MKFESMTIDHYQMTSHFSQKVFLGGIPAELTEGKVEKENFDRNSLDRIRFSGIVVGFT